MARPALPVGLSRAEPLGSRQRDSGLGPSGFHPSRKNISSLSPGAVSPASRSQQDNPSGAILTLASGNLQLFFSWLSALTNASSLLSQIMVKVNQP
jgi:hypothetical protein